MESDRLSRLSMARSTRKSHLLAIAIACGVTAFSANSEAGSPSPIIAVLYFDHTGTGSTNEKFQNMDYLRKGLAEMMIADLTGTPGVTVVERIRLEEVMAELQLSQTKKVDRKTALKIGRLLGASYIVFGAYFVDFQDQLMITAKITHVESGENLRGKHYHGKPEEFYDLQQSLAQDLRAFLTGEVTIHAREWAREHRRARKPVKSGEHKAASRRKHKASARHKVGDSRPVRVKAVGSGKKRRSAKPGTRLDVNTAARYGRALDAMDRGDKKAARSELEHIVAKNPDFELASANLASLAH